MLYPHIQNDGTALVVVTEVFKGSFSLNDLIYIRYSCGAFPVRVGSEGVYFTTSTSSVGGSIVAYLAECTRNGPASAEERAQLRSGHFSVPCTDASTGKIYQDGATFSSDCNTCSCSAGSIACTKMACPPTKGCSLKNGKVIPEGATTKVDCNTCTCTNGMLACTEMACALTYCVDDETGERRINGEIWLNGCTEYICQSGIPKIRTDRCGRSVSFSKVQIIGVSLAAVIVVIIVISIATVIRNRMRAREAERDGILLEEVNKESDSDDNSSFNNHSVNYNNNVGSGFTPQVFGTQPMMYNPAPAGWGMGQPLQTTPMVLMTQTGEPVVVQVAYM